MKGKRAVRPRSRPGVAAPQPAHLAAEIRLRDVAIASSTSAIALADPDGLLTYANAAFLDLWGLASPDEAHGRHVREFLDCDDRLLAALATLKESGVFAGELRGRRRDGTGFDVQASVRLATDAAGRAIGMAGSFLNVTPRRQAETALRTSEQWLEEAQRVGRLGWFSYHPGSDVFTVSESVREIFGVTHDHPTHSKAWIELIHPDDRARVNAAFRQGIAGQVSPDIEYRIVRPSDGQERWLHTYNSTIFDTSGRVERIFGTVQDETDRRHAEAEIRRLAAAVEQAAQSVVITDTAGTIEYVNASFTATTGYARDEVLGRTPRVLKSGLHGPEHYAALWSTILAGRTWVGGFTNRRRDGSHYEAEATITPVRDAVGNIACFVSLEQDVTEQIAARRKLQEQETLAAIGAIATNIAHEIKNPLFAISSGIQLLMEELVLDEEQKKTFKVIHGDVVRMDRLVRQLQLLSSRPGLHLSAHAPGGLVGAALTLNRGLLAEKELHASVDVAPGCPDLLVDGDQVHQILLNLVQNAISFSPRGGAITITAAPAGDGTRVVLRIANDGPPIPAGLAERIFEPFFTTRRPSTGMGLAISRRIALDHGGSLRAEVLPQGAAFVLELPARGSS